MTKGGWKFGTDVEVDETSELPDVPIRITETGGEMAKAEGEEAAEDEEIDVMAAKMEGDVLGKEQPQEWVGLMVRRYFKDAVPPISDGRLVAYLPGDSAEAKGKGKGKGKRELSSLEDGTDAAKEPSLWHMVHKDGAY